MPLFHRFVRSQQTLSRWFDRLLPLEYRVDGNRDFLDRWIIPRLKAGAVVYDVGGGKNPVISLSQKRRFGLRVIGLDIDPAELAAAPPGAYDETIRADIAQHRGPGDADLVICQALLEHVSDSAAAMRAIASLLKPGGVALIFVPSRNAVFARLNLLLPESSKRRLLYTVFPSTRRNQGFPAYYDRCTPRDFRQMAASNALEVELCKPYFRSGYFNCFFPLHLLWRLWLLLFRSMAGEQAAETFSLALRKQADGAQEALPGARSDETSATAATTVLATTTGRA